MRRALLMLALVCSACGGGSTPAPSPLPTSPTPIPSPTPTPPPTTSASDLVFLPDAGRRLDQASNPAAGVDASGAVYLYYEDRSQGGQQRVAIAPDGLSFGAGSPFTTRENDSRRTLLPDRSWRLYQYDPQARVMRSQRSADGVMFAREDGVRYAPHATDNGTLGVYDAFSDARGGVVLLYLGDLMGQNNLRRAYSTDNGTSFAFERGNLLGDAGSQPSQAHVDPKALRLPDGRLRLFTMRGGTGIFSFISADDGQTFALESGTRLATMDFTEFALTILNDPVVVRLPDGRYRMYVATTIGGRPAIVSATAARS